MTDTLKGKNRRLLALFAAANAGAAAFLTAGLPAATHWTVVARALAVPGLSALIVGVATWVLPARVKETLVFWRVGPSRLPSSRAFSKIAKNDPRIDTNRLRKRLGEFPRTATAQTAKWYALYRLHVTEPAVVDPHRAFLLFRDMAALSVLMLVLLGPLMLLMNLPLQRVLAASLGLGLEYVLLAVAAANAGARLVANVLAIEASAPQSDKPHSDPV